MLSWLWFALAIAGMFSLVPLSALAVSGRWRDALHAAKAYGFVMLLVIGLPMVVGAMVVGLSLLIGIDPT